MCDYIYIYISWPLAFGLLACCWKEASLDVGIKGTLNIYKYEGSRIAISNTVKIMSS
jgi:hypothetical protein